MIELGLYDVLPEYNQNKICSKTLNLIVVLFHITNFGSLEDVTVISN